MGIVTRFRRARRGSSTKRPRRRVRLPHLLGLAVAVGALGGFLLFDVSATPGGDRSVLLTLWDKLGNLAGSAVDATGLGDCNIKGNISVSGERIYHLPSDKYYGATLIEFLKGERYFCSEAEARAAGWRRARV